MVTGSMVQTGSGGPVGQTQISTTEYFDDQSKEIRWSDIERIVVNESENMRPGWISGVVFMVFASKQKSEAQIKTQDGHTLIQLKISISAPDYYRFQFVIGQSLKISLRGARAVKTKAGTSVPGYMHFHLVFHDGATIQFVDRRNVDEGTVIDSWQGAVHFAASTHTHDENAQQDGDWFLFSQGTSSDRRCTPTRADSIQAPSSSSHSSPLPETPRRVDGSVPPDSSITISNGNDDNEDLAMDVDVQNLNQNMINLAEKRPVHTDDSDDESVTGPGHRAKKSKKRDTRHHRLREITAGSGSDSREAKSTKGPKLSAREKRKRRRRQTEQATPETAKRNPALDLIAGLTTGSCAYPPLESIRANNFINVIGVVADIGPPARTRAGDFSLTVTLVDPSRFQSGTGFKVTCFMKPGFEHLLPTSLKGHTLLLRNVKTTEWHSNVNGTLYPDKLRWVGYNPDTGKLYYPDAVTDVPQSSYGPAFSASYQPMEAEIQYLAQLGDWWQAIKEEQESGAIHVADYSRRRLEHRLIGSCDVDQFFNATVEILKIEEVERGQTMLFFSDYTPHPQRSTEGYYGQWAVHASTDRIDPALLDSIKPATYWSIKNMRLKISSLGYVEADLYAARLHEVEDENDLHLSELLKRKQAYLKDNPQNPEQIEVSECVISDISSTGHYNIIAELVYKAKPRDAVTDLYITDYTDNPNLSSFKPERLRAQLNESPLTVLQITAWDGHELVRDMEIGGVYSFSDVRIKDHHESGLRGNLKFADKRITRMNVKKTDNEAVLALLQRRKDFVASGIIERRTSVPLSKTRKDEAPIMTSQTIKSRHTDQPKSSIREIVSTQKCPNKFRLIAHISDFFPIDIVDFAIRWCTSCNTKIPDERNACVKCEDFMAEHVKWAFDFYFVLGDEEGETLLVNVGSEAKYFLLGLKPCDLRENNDALLAVKRRLRGCLGNLVEVHEAAKRGDDIEPELGPYFDLAIKSWEVRDGDERRVLYALTGCEAVDPPT
ncbi:hypothetical protein ACEPAH_4497 [Sanghuangporus vaninii]